MNFVCDEGVDRGIVLRLRAEGHEVVAPEITTGERAMLVAGDASKLRIRKPR